MEYSEKLKKVLAEINSKSGDDIVVSMEAKTANLKIAGSWGSLLVDSITGGGLVEGRLYELYGEESSSKTTLALSAIADSQSKDRKPSAFIDVEQAFDPRYAAALGVDTSKLILIQPNCEEEALEAMIQLVNSGEIDICVLDSTSALVPRAEMVGDDAALADVKMGLKARLLNKAVYQISLQANKQKVTCIFISQMRDNFNMFGSNKTIGVGNGLKFFASCRIKTSRIGRIEGTMPNGEKGVIAIPVKIQTTKNKLAAPFQECEILVEFGKGISLASEYIQVAQNINLLYKDGRGLILKFETPLFPADTPLASSMPKLLEIFNEIEDETHPYFWIKKEIELRVKEQMGQITENDIEAELADKYASKERETELAIKYLDYATKASSSSKIVEAYYAITKAYNYSPFDKTISLKYKTITKRFEDKKNSLELSITVPKFERGDSAMMTVNFNSGEEIDIIEEKVDNMEEKIESETENK